MCSINKTKMETAIANTLACQHDCASCLFRVCIFLLLLSSSSLLLLLSRQVKSWWWREYEREYLPALTKDEPTLIEWLNYHGLAKVRKFPARRLSFVSGVD